METVSIGGVKIEKTAVSAPMAGVCDRAQRVLVREFGAALTFGEMTSSAGIIYNDKKTPKLLMSEEDEKPFAVQIFGNNPEFMAKAVETALQYNPDILDINAGCPMPKITGNNSGSALLKEPKLLGEIIKSVVRTAGKKPVTVKIRSGWDKNSINAAETAKICEAGGAAAVTIHARTREQMYTGFADWEIIKQVKKAVKIPVIGNGDIINSEKCRQMYEQTGCDLVMVGRAAWGAPWIFKEIKTFLETGIIPEPPTLEERLEIMTRHIELLIEDKGEAVAMKQARAHIAKYLRGIRGAAAYRNMCSALTVQEDFLKLKEKIKNHIME
ncbi:MAG: tRNA dihydrouridine synthase DusB [Oscillospiraceae bacterium]|nr:tRNA dihydrouridine synthase DusB [Oscillospiraceae bacterium]